MSHTIAALIITGYVLVVATLGVAVLVWPRPGDYSMSAPAARGPVPVADWHRMPLSTPVAGGYTVPDEYPGTWTLPANPNV